MLRIFISYSRNNQATVESLADDLGRLGHTVWIDQRLKGGQEWWNEILSQIRNCDLFVFALSQEISKSQACGLELKYAQDLGKIILPILIADNVSMNLFPEIISKKQYVDYRKSDKESTIRLINALQNIHTAPRLRLPLPKPPEIPISYIDKLKDEIVSAGPLSFSEQTEIVTKLRYRIEETNEQDDIRYLLLEMKKRDDLYAKIGRDVDDLLTRIPKSTNKASNNIIANRPKPQPTPVRQNEIRYPNPPREAKSGKGGRNIIIIGIVIAIISVCLCIILYNIFATPTCYGYYCY